MLGPWRAARRGLGWTLGRFGLWDDAPFEYPARLGRWPAAVLLLSFVTMELSYTNPSDPRALALAIAIYSAGHVGRSGRVRLGGVVQERRRLRGRLHAPLADQLRSAGGTTATLVVRTPFSGLSVSDATPGTIAMVAVMLGSTFFDGFSRTSIWQNRYYNVQVDLIDRPSLADMVGQLMNLGGLLACVAFVGLAFRLAVAGTESIAERGRCRRSSSTA